MDHDAYLRTINELVSSAAVEVVASRNDSAATARALKNYLCRGREKSLTLEELLDFFGVSGDCVLERAGLPEEESMYLMRLFGEMCDAAAGDRD